MRGIRTGRASRLGRVMCDVLPALLPASTVAGSGEWSPVGQQGVLKLSWPSTADNRMMKLKKKRYADGRGKTGHQLTSYTLCQPLGKIVSRCPDC